jgi:hypothetical protein
MNATCPKCQTENLTTAKFCKKCGSPLGEVQGISNIAIADDKLYEIAMEEIENNSVQKGLYARAFSQSEGDKDKTDALYIKFRVQSLQDELMLEAEQERTLEEEHHKEKLLKEQQLIEERQLELELKAKANAILKLQGQQENEKGGNILFGFLMTGILITLITLISYVAIFGVII